MTLGIMLCAACFHLQCLLTLNARRIRTKTATRGRQKAWQHCTAAKLRIFKTTNCLARGKQNRRVTRNPPATLPGYCTKPGEFEVLSRCDRPFTKTEQCHIRWLRVAIARKQSLKPKIEKQDSCDKKAESCQDRVIKIRERMVQPGETKIPKAFGVGTSQSFAARVAKPLTNQRFAGPRISNTAISVLNLPMQV